MGFFTVRRQPSGAVCGGLVKLAGNTSAVPPGAGSAPGGIIRQRPRSQRPRAVSGHAAGAPPATFSGPAGRPGSGLIIRRRPVGAVCGGLGSLRTTALTPGPAGSKPGGLIRSRRPARAVTASAAGLFNQPPRQPGNPPGGLVVRRQQSGSLWGAGLNYPPLPLASNVARSIPSVTATDTSAATVTDPRDGTATVT